MKSFNIDYLIKEAKQRGCSLIGFADLRDLPDNVHAGLPSAICFAVSLAPKVLKTALTAEPVDNIHTLRQDYTRASNVLKEIASFTVDYLLATGCKAVITSQIDDSYDRENLISNLSEKRIATQAGLGWIGKSGLLITPDYGPAVRLYSILTDAPLLAATPVRATSCPEKCQLCTQACPGQAIKGNLWRPECSRDELIDAKRCRETGLRFAENANLKHPTCGRCIVVCPRTRQFVKK